MFSAPRGRVLAAFALVAPMCVAACALSSDELAHGPEEIDTVAQAVTIPAKGGATTLDIASWNIEWFGDASNGPTDEALQLQNVRDVISGTDFDIWGLAEVVSSSHWNNLESQLPGYTGFLANESNVINGAAYYNDFNNTEQKVGILYKSALATVLDARVILTASDYDFGGRPPLQVTLRVTLNGTTEDVVVIVLHAKCCNDTTSWTRRQNAATALKSYLDTTFPTQKVWVIGDFNDDLDTSITPQKASPYAGFLNDAADYKFPTLALSLAGTASTASYPDTIDHHLNTNDSNALYIAGSVAVYRVDQYITGYSTTTSDHFPVLSRYTWGGGGGGSPAVTVTAPNGGESFVGGTSQIISWTSSGVTTVRLEYSLDSGGTWAVITSSTSASAGTFSWTVPGASSSQALVRISDTASTASDLSNGTFSITPAGGTAQVILNEILANEPGSSTSGEAIEIVNIGTAPASIGGWTLSDASAVRHTFAAGTTLQPGKSLVVFAGASGIPAGLTNALAASTGSLNLGNSGDTVLLKNASGAVADSVTYPASLASTDGVSMNRSPDGTTGGFVLHTAISSLPRSPGTRASGAAW